MVNIPLQNQMNDLSLTEDVGAEIDMIEETPPSEPTTMPSSLPEEPISGTETGDVLLGMVGDDVIETEYPYVQEEKKVVAEEEASPFSYNMEKFYEHTPSKQKDTTFLEDASTGIWPEIKQFAGEGAYAFPEGVLKSDEAVAMLPAAAGWIGNTMDWFKEHTGAAVGVLYDLAIKQEWNPEQFEDVKGISSRFNEIGDLYTLLYKQKYKEIHNDELLSDWGAMVRTQDMPRGLADKFSYWTTMFLGEIISVPMPIFGTAGARVTKMLAGRLPNAVMLNH